MKVFTREEATTVERPKNGPWTWPEPVDVMISNTYKFEPVGSLQWREDRGVYRHHMFDLSQMGDPLMFAIALNMLETLYRNGYAVVQMDGEEDAVGSEQFTAPELLAALKVEQERYEALRSSVRSLAKQMGGSGVKFELLELTQPPESRP